MNSKFNAIICALVLAIPATGHAELWSGLSLDAGSKINTTGAESGFVYGVGYGLISLSGLGVEANVDFGNLQQHSSGVIKPYSSGTLMLQYYLAPFRQITPYIGVGYNAVGFDGLTGSGTRGAAGLLFRSGEGIAFRLEGDYDSLPVIAGSALTGWTVKGNLIFVLSSPPAERGPEAAVIVAPAGGMGDRDGDGVPNRYDNTPRRPGDRDGDGIPNRFDRRPNNPGRY